jgi:hypothetical protein
VGAGIETSGLIDSHRSFQAYFGNTSFGVIDQFTSSAPGAVATRVIFLAFIVADEEVLLKARHDQ